MDTQQPEHMIRVVKGRPDAEELAALTAVVLARAAAHDGQYGGTTGSGPTLAGWHRPERVRGFLGPRTWRDNHANEARSA
ncbi:MULTISPECIES: acyl-CoA carboxylase subunit epsilon [unclassified Streptomyces]|uniref:acyl-CoA carboxylase subunit epsilon n=1 Tax=unclassified Streptomyces TaxID=2593676 RepID=UPI003669645C